MSKLQPTEKDIIKLLEKIRDIVSHGGISEDELDEHDSLEKEWEKIEEINEKSRERASEPKSQDDYMKDLEVFFWKLNKFYHKILLTGEQPYP